MRRIFTLLLLFCLLHFSHAFSQTFENSWINFGQRYFKVKVWQTGLYRISASSLQNNGISTSFPFNDPRRIQLFYKGQEQYIHIHDENNNNIWDGPDYIEFFGQKNDGG